MRVRCQRVYPRAVTGSVLGMSSRLVRPRNEKVIAGVCAGLARRFGVSKFLVRLGFVIFGLAGVGELVYIVLWIIMPKEE